MLLPLVKFKSDSVGTMWNSTLVRYIVIITLAIIKRYMISFLEVRHVCSEHSWLIIQFSFDCLI